MQIRQKTATSPAISAILAATPPSTSAVRARLSLRSALRSLFAARFALYRLRCDSADATGSGFAAEAALFLAMAILFFGLLVSDAETSQEAVVLNAWFWMFGPKALCVSRTQWPVARLCPLLRG